MKKCEIYIVKCILAQFKTNVTKNSVVTDHFKRHRETDPKTEVNI
jgi:hypothetical protein